MKKLIILLVFILLIADLKAKKYDFEEISFIGVENPVGITVSPDGLRMIVIDWPKKSNPIIKEINRPRLSSVWSAAKEVRSINKFIDENTRIEGPAFSFDNKYLYFSANFTDSKGGMDIYYCTIDENGFSDPINLGSPINSDENENFPSISGNNRSFFFTREVEMKKLKEFSTGELWFSQQVGREEKWSEPEKINTIINDGGIASSKIYDDNKTLIYSRVDNDKDQWKIHWAKRFGDIHWFLPVKLDSLATQDSEISPVYCKQDGYLYFIKYSYSGHPKGTIYRHKLEEIFCPEKTIRIGGIVSDSINNKPISATILVTDPLLGRISFLTKSDSLDGSWNTLLLANNTYMFHTWKPNYSHKYQLFPEETTNNNLNINYPLTPQTELQLNIYDKEELWPLEGELTILNDNGEIISMNSETIAIGQKKMILAIGKDYTFKVSKKDYYENSLRLALSNTVLFDKFVRDIELIPIKREIEIFVVDEETKAPINASIEFFDKRAKSLIPVPVKGVLGLYVISLREGEQFDVEIRGPKDFAFKHIVLNLDSDRTLKRLYVELSPLKKMVPLLLNNINFEFNSSDLMESSFPELNRVVQLLKDNPDIYVELSAHTDDIGSDRYNNVLANKRANSVVAYLSIKGINNKRMVARGYGETRPLVANDTEENRSLNRRVELKILDEENSLFMIDENLNK